MYTNAERQFTEDFQAYKNLFVLSGFKGKEKVISWIRSHGQTVITQAEKEVHNFKGQFSRQSEFEKEELSCMHEQDGYNNNEDE